MKRHYQLLFLGFGLVTSVFIIVSAAQAISKDDVVYPVAELGGCKSEIACRTYCDAPDNFSACFVFARKYNLLKGPVANIAEEDVDHFAAVLKNGGPGGCKTQNACETFCDNAANMGICIEFAEENNLIPEEELAEVRKVKAALDRGVTLPAGCTNKEKCEAACERPPNKEVAKQCFAFAKEAGLLPPDFDEEKTERMFVLIDEGEIDFAAMKQCENLGKGGEVEEAILDRCLDVGEKLGFMKPGEKEMARRMMREGGPKGCRGSQCKEVCEEDPEACMAYFEEKGIPFPEEAQEQMRDGLEQMKEAFADAPEEVAECLKKEIGEEAYAGIETGTIKMSQMARLGPKLGTVMQGCFTAVFGSEEQEFDGGFPGGPGGGGQDMMMQECFAEVGFDPRGGKPPPSDIREKVQACVEEKFMDQGGFPGGMGEFRGGGEFGGDQGQQDLSCSPKGTVASYVCAKNGRGAPPNVETTYFNECTAKEHGAEILHGGLCKGHKPCSDIADPVCGRDGNTWVNACGAEEKGGGVQYQGVCKEQSRGGQGSGLPRGVSGGGMPPGARECMAELGIKGIPAQSDMKRVEECVRGRMMKEGVSPGSGGSEDRREPFEGSGPRQSFMPSEGMMEGFKDHPPTPEELDEMRRQYAPSSGNFPGAPSGNVLPPEGSLPRTMPSSDQYQQQYDQEAERIRQEEIQRQTQQLQQQYQQYPGGVPSGGTAPQQPPSSPLPFRPGYPPQAAVTPRTFFGMVFETFGVLLVGE